MKLRNGQRKLFFSLLVALTILTTSCQLTAKQVSPPAPTEAPQNFSTPTITTLQKNPTIAASPSATATISGPFKMVIPVDELLSGTTQRLISTDDGSLWLVTDREIAKITGSTMTVYLTGLEGHLAGIDAMGKVWVVNEDTTKISAWDGKAWTNYSADAGWAPFTSGYYQNVRGGQSDTQGRIWFTTSQDVRVFDGTRWTIYTPQDMGMEPPLYEDLEAQFEVTVLKDGMVWVTECDWGGPGPFGGRGIRWFDGSVWHGASFPVASGCALTIVEDSNGNVWAGVDSSLWRYDPVSDAWTEFAPPEPSIVEMHFGFIDSLSVDPNGTLWPILDLCGGASCFVKNVLYQFQNENWTQVGEVEDFTEYWGPVFDTSGIPWLYWNGAMYRIIGSMPELTSPLAGRIGAAGINGKVWFVAPYEGRDMLWVLDAESKD